MLFNPILTRMTFAMATAALGITITKIALPVLAGVAGFSVAQIGLIGGSAASAWPIFGLIAGWSLDRYGRAAVFRLGLGLTAIAAALLLLVFHTGGPVLLLLCGLALMAGIGEVLTETSGQTLLPELIDKDCFERGNNWLQGGKTVATMLLAPLFLSTLLGFQPVWSFGLVFALMVASLILLPLPNRRPARVCRAPVAEASIQGFFRGLRLLGREPAHRWLTALLTAMTISWGGWMTLIVPYSLSRDHLDLDASGVGLIMTILGCGSVVGALGYPLIKQRIGARGTLFLDPLASVVLLIVPGFGLGQTYVLGAAFFAGIGAVTWAVWVAAYQQTTIPAATLGRAVAAYRWIGWTGFFVGATSSGLIADNYGLRVAFLVFALPAVVSILIFCGRYPIKGANQASGADTSREISG